METCTLHIAKYKSTMSEPELWFGNVAVQMNSNIFVFGGRREDGKHLSFHEIWVYNEQWTKHVIPANTTAPPQTTYACAVAVEPDIYMFGGVHIHYYTNDLWKLSITSERSFNWSKIRFQSDMQLPSPRYQHSGWEYKGCLWVFGGRGAYSWGYLNDNGHFMHHQNNQLLCYCPLSLKWTNPMSFGATPSPRYGQCTTIMMHKVWLYGGMVDRGRDLDDLFELRMQSLTWTQILASTNVTKRPSALSCASLNRISNGQLVLHGGRGHNIDSTDTWVMDLSSHTWIKHIVSADHPCFGHTSFLGENKCVIIIGGRSGYIRHTSDRRDRAAVHVRLQSESLQQLAMQVIYKHRTALPCKCLPSKLLAQLEIVQKGEI